ncbi:helix-turn-helix transcriptional regulator [Actinosynnema sp. NPDC020468]|uniref:helix-turn-helix domain-containing protein n=1 Tax=Actinosynnema sp. NPDC020468 TaxID=3154488 RepID=UPI0034099086
MGPGALAHAEHDEPGPIVQKLIFGARLKELRETSRLTVDDASDAITARLPKEGTRKRKGMYEGKLSKIESGTLRMDEEELEAALAVYRVTGPEAEDLRNLGVQARRKQPKVRVPDHSRRFVWLEHAADQIAEHYPCALPGNLQTRQYALAQLSTSLVVSPPEMESMAVERVARGDRFTTDPNRLLHVLLDEEALRRQIGTPAVMSEQLDRLLVFADLPNVTIQVIPTSVGSHAALGYSFSMLYIAEAKAHIVYVETLTSAEYLDRPHHVDRYKIAFELAEKVALKPSESAAFLHALKRDM